MGIPPAPRGIPQIEVSFDIDANGILNVNAKDLGTGKEQKITITGSSGLNDSEIERMVKEAESHSDEDKRKKEEIEARNRADNMVYGTEKLLRENRSKISDQDAKAIEDAIAETKKAMEQGGVDRINSAVERLTQASHRLAEVMYQSAQGRQQPQGESQTTSGGQGQGRKPDDVIDAEYVDMDDKK
jgi:molecular chaperone DnaK